jgi:hypothetical protein
VDAGVAGGADGPKWQSCVDWSKLPASGTRLRDARCAGAADPLAVGVPVSGVDLAADRAGHLGPSVAVHAEVRLVRGGALGDWAEVTATAAKPARPAVAEVAGPADWPLLSHRVGLAETTAADANSPWRDPARLAERGSVFLARDRVAWTSATPAGLNTLGVASIARIADRAFWPARADAHLCAAAAGAVAAMVGRVAGNADSPVRAEAGQLGGHFLTAGAAGQDDGVAAVGEMLQDPEQNTRTASLS